MEVCVERPNRSSASVHFRLPKRLQLALNRNDEDVHLQLQIRNVDRGDEWSFILDVAESVSFTLPIPLPPGNRFALNGRLLMRWLPPLDVDRSAAAQSAVFPVGYKTIDSAQTVFRAELTMDEIKQLLLKSISFMALQYRSPNQLYLPCRYFYRNKPHEYFNNIFNYHAGIMAIYRKNNNGDPASPINGQIDGLFFGVNVDHTTGLPVVPSLYGPARLNILSWFMIQSAPKMYFCDFYCHFRSHHVTLVLTKPGSAADGFCTSRLKLLDIYQNPFLYYDSKSQTVWVTTRVWVQVFYTENINISCVQQSNLGYLEDVPSQPVPVTTVEGVPKNPVCSICNIN